MFLNDVKAYIYRKYGIDIKVEWSVYARFNKLDIGDHASLFQYVKQISIVDSKVITFFLEQQEFYDSNYTYEELVFELHLTEKPQRYYFYRKNHSGKYREKIKFNKNKSRLKKKQEIKEKKDWREYTKNEKDKSKRGWSYTRYIDKNAVNKSYRRRGKERTNLLISDIEPIKKSYGW